MQQIFLFFCSGNFPLSLRCPFPWGTLPPAVFSPACETSPAGHRKRFISVVVVACRRQSEPGRHGSRFLKRIPVC